MGKGRSTPTRDSTRLGAGRRHSASSRSKSMEGATPLGTFTNCSGQRPAASGLGPGHRAGADAGGGGQGHGRREARGPCGGRGVAWAVPAPDWTSLPPRPAARAGQRRGLDTGGKGLGWRPPRLCDLPARGSDQGPLGGGGQGRSWAQGGARSPGCGGQVESWWAAGGAHPASLLPSPSEVDLAPARAGHLPVSGIPGASRTGAAGRPHGHRPAGTERVRGGPRGLPCGQRFGAPEGVSVAQRPSHQPPPGDPPPRPRLPSPLPLKLLLQLLEPATQPGHSQVGWRGASWPPRLTLPQTPPPSRSHRHFWGGRGEKCPGKPKSLVGVSQTSEHAAH